MLKGKLSLGFTIYMGTSKISVKKEVRYLGVRIGERLNFQPHFNYLKNTAEELYSRLKSTSGVNWGKDYRVDVLLYRTIFLPKSVCM